MPRGLWIAALVTVLVGCALVAVALVEVVRYAADQRETEQMRWMQSVDPMRSVDLVWDRDLEALHDNPRVNMHATILVQDPTEPKHNGLYEWTRAKLTKQARWRPMVGQTLYERSQKRPWVVLETEPALKVVSMRHHWFVGDVAPDEPEGFVSLRFDPVVQAEGRPFSQREQLKQVSLQGN